MSDPDTHIYGMAEDDNGQSSAPEGMRGERAPTVDDPALRRDTAVAGGRVTVQESSGVAFVEASGAAGGALPDAPDPAA
jgi:hypothetical protein